MKRMVSVFGGIVLGILVTAGSAAAADDVKLVVGGAALLSAPFWSGRGR